VYFFFPDQVSVGHQIRRGWSLAEFPMFFKCPFPGLFSVASLRFLRGLPLEFYVSSTSPGLSLQFSSAVLLYSLFFRRFIEWVFEIAGLAPRPSSLLHIAPNSLIDGLGRLSLLWRASDR